MADCGKCKWYVNAGEECLLGRDIEKCTKAPARRGDDDLFDRMMELSDKEFSEVKSYFRRNQ